MSSKGLFDPLKVTEEIRRVVVKRLLRKYYRVARGGHWYGGIATCDCVGCNLKCVFCWSNYPRDNPDKVGKFYSPEAIFHALDKLAKKRGYRLVRISGNEPTISREHLLKVLEYIENSPYLFILETNGILIGADKSYAKDLSKFTKVHVRVSLKGTTPEEFSKLTGAIPEAFELQLKALENLLDYGVDCHPAVMLSFSTEEGVRQLIERLNEIDKSLVNSLEEEYIILYPHVVRRLKEANLKPRIYFR